MKGTDGTCTSATATVYTYDADGRRVAKNTGAGAVIEEYVYDLKGDQSSAHDAAGAVLRSELYSPDGRHVASRVLQNGNYNLYYNHADWLGTERVRTNSVGTAVEWCTDTPYGMNANCSPLPDTSPMHFTGKQKDAESGNDYFGARYLASGTNLGRFMTPDWASDGSPVPYAKLDNPQTLNLYAYLRNNPLNTIDPDGHGESPPTMLCGAPGQIGCGNQLHIENSEGPTVLATQAGTTVLEPPPAPAPTEPPPTAPAPEAPAPPPKPGVPPEVGPVSLLGVVGAVVADLIALDALVTNVTNTLVENAKGREQYEAMASVVEVENAHKTGARESTRQTHQEGEARKSRDRGGEKGDKRPPRKRPKPQGGRQWKGPWPPKDGHPWW